MDYFQSQVPLRFSQSGAPAWVSHQAAALWPSQRRFQKWGRGCGPWIAHHRSKTFMTFCIPISVLTLFCVWCLFKISKLIGKWKVLLLRWSSVCISGKTNIRYWLVVCFCQTSHPKILWLKITTLLICWWFVGQQFGLVILQLFLPRIMPAAAILWQSPGAGGSKVASLTCVAVGCATLSAAAQSKLLGQFRVNVGGDYTRAWLREGLIHWGATTTGRYLLTSLVDRFPS